MKRFTTFSAMVALAVLTTSVASAAPSSGMLLGVYAFPNSHGLRITGTIPGYSAHGKLFANDVLRRVTADGVNVYKTNSHWAMEHAKDMIGPYQPAALEIYRPGYGLEYLWVEFRPVSGSIQYKNGNPASGTTRMEARIFTEQEKPGARALFNRGAGFTSQPAPVTAPAPHSRPFGGSAASLFGR